MHVPAIQLLLVAIGLLATVGVAQRDRGCCEDYCYDTDNERPQAKWLGTKTAYHFIRGSQNPRQYFVPNCTPVKFWMLARHGTRLPDAGKLQALRELGTFRDEIIRNYEERRTKPDQGWLCDEDLELLKNWYWDANMTDDRAGALTGQGWTDLVELAQAYQIAFPRLLDNIYTPTKYQFRYTTVDRTNTSRKAFLEGLFGGGAYDAIQTPLPVEQDLLLRPYAMCPSWNRIKEDKKDDDTELSKFEEGQQYQKMLGDVSRRLGFKITLAKKQVKLIYDMCRYDTAWSLDRPSAWCTAFTKSQIQILEYAEDLKYSREAGYGNIDLNSNVACALVKDMLRNLESKENPAVTAYFAHSSTLQLLLTALDTYRDAEPLRADNFAQMSRRKWRVSEITPFAGNLAAIKYDCPNDNERTKVMFVHNQRPIYLPFCNVGLCDWSQVKRQYQRFDGADCAKTFCRPSGASSQSAVGWSALAVTALGVIGQYF